MNLGDRTDKALRKLRVAGLAARGQGPDGAVGVEAGLD